MPRAQCIVHRGNELLMVQHRQGGETWWCLPGGGIEEGETPAEAAIRELEEECGVAGTILREMGCVVYAPGEGSYTFLVDIGAQDVRLGSDPEFDPGEQVLVDARWMTLSQIPERDRAFLWAAGLLGVKVFLAEVEGWGNEISYPAPDAQTSSPWLHGEREDRPL
jgi:8-oxo-dGTP pyrophosphatase MutT (NUDIX family)